MARRASVMVNDKKHVAYNYWTGGGYQTGHMLVPLLNTIFAISSGRSDVYFMAQYGSSQSGIWCTNDYTPITFTKISELRRVDKKVLAFRSQFGKNQMRPYQIAQILSRVWIPPNERIIMLQKEGVVKTQLLNEYEQPIHSNQAA